jgi:predicted RNA-binding Zn ribbon-like protein
MFDEGTDVEFQIIAGEACLDFINTLDNRPSPERHKELLSTYRDLADWAAQAGVIAAAQRVALVRSAEAHPNAALITLRKAIELRECLCRIVSSRLRGRRPASDDIALFNRFLGEALSNLQLQAGRSGFRLDWQESEAKLDALLWPVIKSASDLLTSPDLERVRECGSPSCRWLFVDRSKNHSRRWCDMKVCGNRLKARRFYQRQHATS